MHVPAVAGVLAAAVAGAPDLTDVVAIVAKHLDACGGAQRLRAISSSRESGTITVKDGARTSTGPALSEEKRPNKSRSERTVHGVQAIWAFDGATAWLQRDGAKPEALSGELAKNLAANDFDHFLLDYGSRGIKVELLGVTAVETGPAYKLKVTLRDGAIRFSYLDKATFLEVRRDYVETDGSGSQHCAWSRAKGRPPRAGCSR